MALLVLPKTFPCSCLFDIIALPSYLAVKVILSFCYHGPPRLALLPAAPGNCTCIYILEIRDSQNLAKLGLGGKPSLAFIYKHLIKFSSVQFLNGNRRYYGVLGTIQIFLNRNKDKQIYPKEYALKCAHKSVGAR